MQRDGMKAVIISGIFIVILILIVLTLNKDSSTEEEIKAVKVAICPTMYPLFKDTEGLDLVLVDSTAQAVQKLKTNEVEYVISGRIPKPSEDISEYKILREGFSFLGNTESVISYEELLTKEIYTDLENVSDILTNVVIVDDVYEYLEKGIVVTSWENTDLNRGSIVHILNEDGSRWDKSRTPVLFSLGSIDEKLLQILN